MSSVSRSLRSSVRSACSHCKRIVIDNSYKCDNHIICVSCSLCNEVVSNGCIKCNPSISSRARDKLLAECALNAELELAQLDDFERLSQSRENARRREAKRASRASPPPSPPASPRAAPAAHEERKDGKEAKAAAAIPEIPAIAAPAPAAHMQPNGFIHPDVLKVANHGRRITRRIPVSEKHRFGHLCSRFFAEYMACGDKQGPKATALVQILRLPARALFVSSSSVSGSQLRKRLRRQMEAVAMNREADLQEIEPEVAAQRIRDPLISKIQRAHALLRVGEQRRAVRVLLDAPMIAIDDSVIEQLRALHPARADEPMPDLPANSVAPIFDRKEVSAHIRKLPNGVAPGLSGWTYDLVKAACTSDVVLDGITALVNDIVGGKLCPRARQLLVATRSIPLGKKGPGVRPIGIGEVWYRIAASLIVRSIAEHAGLALNPNFCIGIKGGAQTAVHLIQQALDHPTEKRILFMGDYANAFNSIHTQKALASLFAIAGLSPVFPMAHWAYACSTPTVVQEAGGKVRNGGAFLRRTGVGQGDPLGSLLFACGLKPVLDAITIAAKGGDVVAFADDVNVATCESQLPAVVAAARDKGAERGLQLVPPKCKLFWPHAEEPSPETITFARDQGIVIIRSATELLGCAVGKDEAAVISILTNKVESLQALYDTVLHDSMSIQDAFAIVSSSSITHILRACPPSVTRAPAKLFDTVRETTLNRKINVAPCDFQSKRMRLPIGLGGAGLISAELIAPACYVAGRAEAAAFLQPMITKHGDAAHEVSAKAVQPALASVTQTFKGDVAQSLPAASSFVATYAAQSVQKLQHDLIRPHHVAMAEAILNDCKTVKESALLRSTRAKKSGLWLCSHEQHISNSAFAIGWRLRFGFDPATDMPEMCPFCKVQDMQLDPWHWLSCKVLGGKRTHRHNALMDELASWIRQLGGFTQLEPAQLGDNRTRPDTDSIIGNSRIVTDVSVVHPLAASHVSVAARRELATAEAREQAKRNKYDGMVQARGAKFFPVVLETTGGMGKDCALALASIISAAKNCSRWAPREVVHGIRSRLSVAVLRWNASIISEGLWRARPLR